MAMVMGKEPNKNRLDPTRKMVKQQIETISQFVAIKKALFRYDIAYSA